MPRPTAAGWLRLVLRGVPMVILNFGGLILLLLIRLVERPVYGMHRPVTGRLVQGVCILCLKILGLRLEVSGRPMKEGGAVVANHSSWLDIFVLNAAKRIYFVSKAEVAGWAGIGWLARATGTVFIRRDRREAQAQTEVFRERMGGGHKLLFFPEGTSTDNMRVLPFKTTLFASFFDPALRPHLHVQPVTVIYHAPYGEDRRFYGWFGEMGFGVHAIQMLSAARGGRVQVIWHTPLAAAEAKDRKALAAAAEAAVRGAMPPERQIT
ncbi:acyl-phosphate glycerol 3-phosphate acyltransferase [Oceanicola sp. 22II-s10i]|uniref:lysophospholipid acyltransferase family protein n=1 Tax=Oceanicola sp. 22II-s10i TaxID=1317116 RepID=UPI000B523B6D|nr:lysophospholipid acyltransferase family protein [Oceanicola sp. 22II-s10i]OWU84953.1 acyl-phosphate glycerol 3-phosphate acyltransferase [Oceanicola sp. 22II-s10i]